MQNRSGEFRENSREQVSGKMRYVRTRLDKSSHADIPTCSGCARDLLLLRAALVEGDEIRRKIFEQNGEISDEGSGSPPKIPGAFPKIPRNSPRSAPKRQPTRL
jgi:hypothetical protein